MEKSESDEKISIIHGLTVKMLDAAKKGEWESLNELQVQREPLMQFWMNLSSDIVKNLSEKGQLQLAEVLEAERQIVDMVRSRMEFLSGNIRDVVLEYKVRKAYSKDS